ncbi:MAG: DUF932 domain-containing protein [Planctomycetes bacterium]|nr:DUF932 domain-containing protein [Planctomycetota bacterium]
MRTQNLKQAHNELFRRTPDEQFPSLAALVDHCRADKERATDRWLPPQELTPRPQENRLILEAGSDGVFLMNDWSFTQLCGLARVSKDTINRLSPDTAAQAFRETLPSGNKPLQLLTSNGSLRSIHGISYTRLWNADLLQVVQEFAVDFQPPQQASTGGAGLYCGEQDLFVFLVDPTGWAEIEGETFAPGFFLWNSEVGKRSVGVSTFWFQKVCANHIVWDSVEVQEFSRKHTANVHEALAGVRRTIEQLVERRDQRRDSFVRVVEMAMQTKLPAEVEEAQKLLARHGVTRSLANQALETARRQGALTIFAVVDALTRLAREMPNAGERLEADHKAASLLDLVEA